MASKNPSIHFVIMGGTIDSFYDGTKDTAVPNRHSVVPRYIAGTKMTSCKFSEIAMKDSRQLGPADINKMVHAIEKSPCTKIVVTHGTYTLPDTARYLKVHLKRKDQTIVFTGSMIPLEFPFSDGGFNLGFAVSKAQTLEAGIYICFDGRVFTPEEVAKDIRKGKYYSIYTR